MKLRKFIILAMACLSLVSVTACGSDKGGSYDSDGNKSDYTKASEENFKHQYKNADIGGIIEFGTYEQDNNEKNGTEPIEWIVLEKEENKLLIISKYCLDVKPYNDYDRDVTWEFSTIRQWLNNTFIETAFSEYEKEIIVETQLTNPDNDYGFYDYGKGGNDTKDKVFLLSIEEARNYFASDSDRIADVTEYAKEQGADTNFADSNIEFPRWWLRSAGCYADRASNINEDGSISKGGFSVEYDGYCIRPALWITIE